METKNLKILYTTPELKYPAIGGPYLRVQNSIKALSRISQLHLISRVDKETMGGDRAEEFYKNLSYKFSYLLKPGKINKNLSYKIKKIFLGKEKTINEIISSYEVDYIIDYVKKNNIDIIWFGYGNISYDLMKNVRKKAPYVKCVCDTDSVWSRFVLRKLPFIEDEKEKLKVEQAGRKKEKEEADWVNFCDVTTAVSEIDADYYKSLTKDKSKIKLFSNVLDLDSYSNKPEPPQDFKTPNIYFAGYFGPNSPTDIAARWVINDILPLVKKEIPNIHFYIIGNGSDTTLADIKDENVTVTGCLDSVLPYLCNANVALVPLKFESGTRFKILEAGACNIPIVSTTLGAEGIPVENEKNIIIADEAEDFAKGIIKIIQNPEFAKNMADNLKGYILKNYSIEKHSKEAQEIIDFILKK